MHCRHTLFSTLLMCHHICIFLCPPVRYTLRWSLTTRVWSVITIFPSSWDWTAHPPAGIEKSPSSASLLIPVVFLSFFLSTNDYFQRFVSLKKKYMLCSWGLNTTPQAQQRRIREIECDWHPCIHILCGSKVTRVTSLMKVMVKWQITEYDFSDTHHCGNNHPDQSRYNET